MSWLEDLTPEERKDWDGFVEHTRTNTVLAMEQSAFVLQLVTGNKEPDIKFAVEIGLAILYNKPILAVSLPGAYVSPKLAQVADVLIETDIDTEAGREALASAIERFREEHLGAT